MNKVKEYAPLVCAICWFSLLAVSLIIKEADFRLAFMLSASVNVAVFIAQFVVVKRNDG